MSNIGLLVASTCCLMVAIGLYLAALKLPAFLALGTSVAFDVVYARRMLAAQRKAKDPR